MSAIKLFIPLLDNGQGDIKADFLRDFFVAFAGRQICLVRASDSHPGRSRNRAAAEFLCSDCTHLLFIDGDIGFQPADVARMFTHDAPIVGGIYCLKTVEAVKPCLQTLPNHQPVETGGLLPVARTGTGFLRIAREVFEKMIAAHGPEIEYFNHGRPEWDFFSSGVQNGEWKSEDWFFCDRARALGYQVLIDTEIQLLHEGTVKYPLQRTPDRLTYCPPEIKGHLERIWKGEYAIPLDPPPATVLDCGANVGAFTTWACEQWPQARVTAFEPHPDNATLFRLNTRHLAQRITFQEAAVSNRDEFSTLVEGTNSGEHSLLFPEGFGPTVQVIDSRALPSAEFVKIDTEGSELFILHHLDLSATRAIALEYHTAADRQTLSAFLDSRGFQEIAHEPLAADRGILKFTRRP